MIKKIIGACLALILAGCASPCLQQNLVQLDRKVFRKPVQMIGGTVREINITEQVLPVGPDGKLLLDPRINTSMLEVVRSSVTINLGPSCAASGTCVPVGN